LEFFENKRIMAGSKIQAEICLLRFTLFFLLDDPGVDTPGVSGDNLSDQAL
jgi:hypothetical protein